MRRAGLFLALPAMLALGACEAPVMADLPADAGAKFDGAVASIGCELRTERDYLPVELQTGLTREQTIALAQRKLSTGEAVSLEGGAVRLVTGACAA